MLCIRTRQNYAVSNTAYSPMKCLRVLSAETFGVHKILKILHFRTLVPNIIDTGPIDALTAFIRTKNIPALRFKETTTIHPKPTLFSVQ
jgi:hypothetical protein